MRQDAEFLSIVYRMYGQSALIERPGVFRTDVGQGCKSGYLPNQKNSHRKRPKKRKQFGVKK